MAYSTANPPTLMTSNIGGTGAIWKYVSTDAAAVVTVAGYITDAADLGMKVGDFVIALDSDTGPTTTLHSVSAIAANGSSTLV